MSFVNFGYLLNPLWLNDYILHCRSGSGMYWIFFAKYQPFCCVVNMLNSWSLSNTSVSPASFHYSMQCVQTCLLSKHGLAGLPAQWDKLPQLDKWEQGDGLITWAREISPDHDEGAPSFTFSVACNILMINTPHFTNVTWYKLSFVTSFWPWYHEIWPLNKS